MVELARRNPRFNEWRSTMRLAVNQEYVAYDHILHDRDEVAVIPPVSGG
jgi:molybdopterin converting factor small subunit